MSSSHDENVKTLIAHADRMWKAEEQNSSRLAARANLVLSGLTALIGLKVFTLGKELDVILAARLTVWLVLLWQAIGLCVLTLARALWLALDVRIGSGRGTSSASQALALDPNTVERILFDQLPPGAPVPEMVFSVTQDAALDLQDRNASRGVAIAKAQILLFAAVGLLVGSMILYTIVKVKHTSPPAVQESEQKEVQHDKNSPLSSR